MPALSRNVIRFGLAVWLLGGSVAFGFSVSPALKSTEGEVGSTGFWSELGGVLPLPAFGHPPRVKLGEGEIWGLGGDAGAFLPIDTPSELVLATLGTGGQIADSRPLQTSFGEGGQRPGGVNSPPAPEFSLPTLKGSGHPFPESETNSETFGTTEQPLDSRPLQTSFGEGGQRPGGANSPLAPESITPTPKGTEHQSGQDTAPPPKVENLPDRKPSAVQEFRRWLDNTLIERTKLFGQRRLAYSFRQVSGDRTAYNTTNSGGFGDQSFTNLGYIRVESRGIYGWLNLDANLQDARFEDPQIARYRLFTERGKWNGQLGDVNARLPSTNRFIQYGRSVNGLQLGYRSGGLEVGLVRTNSRGEARTVTIQGTNSAGPYYLQSSQVIRGSERIEIDGIAQILGQDYTIDYEIGSITFVNRQTLQAKLIPPTSTIVATYESLNFSGGGGRVEGGVVNYNLGRGGKIGITGLRQTTGASADLSTRLEKFQGFGPPSTPYFLQFEPLATQPVVIRVDGVLQTQGVDYTFDASNRAIFYFTRFMPATNQIDVLYTPKPTSSTLGDREVFGIDYTLNLGKGSSLQLSQATGRTTNSPTPSSGTARSARFTYQLGPWSGTTSTRSIPSTFVSVESAGFLRNEDASDITLRHASRKNGDLSLTHLNASITRFTGATAAPTRTRFSRSEISYDLARENTKAFPIRVSLLSTKSQAGTSRTDVDSLNLESSRTWGGLQMRFGASQQKVTGTQPADLSTARLQATYSRSREWQFTAGSSLSWIKSGSDSGQGRELSLTAQYNPTERFNARLGFSDNDAGDLSSLAGIDTGYGAGYNGNGFSSGAGSSFGVGATNGRSLNLFANWEMTDRITGRLSGLIFRSSGNFSSNSESKSLSAGVDVDLGKGHVLSGDLSTSSTEFLESPVRSSVTTGSGSITGSFGKLGYRFTGTALITGGTSTFKQDSWSFDLGLDYRLSTRENLGLLINAGRLSGYLPQDEADLAFSYRYQIWQNLALNANYRYRNIRNRDATLTSGAYRSNTFDIELGFNFSG